MAIVRAGRSGCRAGQASISSRITGGIRIEVVGSWPVAGRPRFLRTADIASVMFNVLRKNGPNDKRHLPFGPDHSQPSQEATHGREHV